MRPRLVVAGAFGCHAVSFGSLYVFGVFFESIAEEFGASRGEVSWILGLGSGTFLLLGAVAGSLADRFGTGRVVAAGGAVLAAGLIAGSRANAIWQLYATQGFVVGLGISALYPPALGAVARAYQTRRRAFATGIAVSGTGVGTFVYAPVARRLIDAVGWRDAMALLGVGGFVLLLASAVAIRGRSGAEHAGMSLGPAVRSHPFRVMWTSGVAVSFAFLIPAAHMVPYARDAGVAALPAAFLLSALGASGTLGRFALGGVAERIGHRRAFAYCVGGMALSQTLWPLARSFGPLVVFAIAFGLFQGGFVSLLPTVAGDYFGTANLSGIVGALNSGAVIGSLAGPTAAGALFDVLGSYVVPVLLSAAACYVSFAILLRLREP
jgi:MFS family permease